MRRLLVSITAVLLVASLPGAGTAEPGFAFGSEQIAFADWIDMKGRTGTIVLAFAFRYPESDGNLVTIGSVGRGTCKKTSTRHFSMLTCRGTGIAREIPFTDFTMHPLMNDAHMTVRLQGQRHTVSWNGRGQMPIGSGGVASNGSSVFAGAVMSRNAKASGNVFGRRMTSNSFMDYGELYFGLGAATRIVSSDGTTRITLSGDRLIVEKKIRTAR